MTKRPNGYVNSWGEYVSRDTLMVHEEPPSVRVTYTGEDGKRFRVVMHQKPNPIGFTARLPGDPKRR